MGGWGDKEYIPSSIPALTTTMTTNSPPPPPILQNCWRPGQRRLHAFQLWRHSSASLPKSGKSTFEREARVAATATSAVRREAVQVQERMLCCWVCSCECCVRVSCATRLNMLNACCPEPVRPLGAVAQSCVDIQPLRGDAISLVSRGQASLFAAGIRPSCSVR